MISPRSLIGFEHGADVELAAEGGLDADLDVVEIDEYGNLQSLIGHFSGISECTFESFLGRPAIKAGIYGKTGV